MGLTLIFTYMIFLCIDFYMTRMLAFIEVALSHTILNKKEHRPDLFLHYDRNSPVKDWGKSGC